MSIVPYSGGSNPGTGANHALITCYNCGELNHISWHCPHPPRQQGGNSNSSGNQHTNNNTSNSNSCPWSQPPTPAPAMDHALAFTMVLGMQQQNMHTSASASGSSTAPLVVGAMMWRTVETLSGADATTKMQPIFDMYDAPAWAAAEAERKAAEEKTQRDNVEKAATATLDSSGIQTELASISTTIQSLAAMQNTLGPSPSAPASSLDECHAEIDSLRSSLGLPPRDLAARACG